MSFRFLVKAVCINVEYMICCCRILSLSLFFIPSYDLGRGRRVFFLAVFLCGVVLWLGMVFFLILF